MDNGKITISHCFVELNIISYDSNQKFKCLKSKEKLIDFTYEFICSGSIC